MTLDPDHTSSSRRILLLLLACVLALVLPFMVMRAVAPHPAASADAGTAALVGGGLATTPRQTTPGAASTSSTSRTSSGTSASTRATTATTATTTGTTTATPATSTAPASSVAGGPLGADAEACRLANLRQQAPLSAAAVSLAQFDKHIDAMNLLVAGKITLAVATTFWDQTRVGAAQNAAAFRSADKQLSAAGPGCTPPDPTVAYATPYGQLLAISSCANAIRARGVALSRARVAVTTWEHHIHDMEMLRMGHITAAQATAAWNKNWRIGASQLAAYDSATAAAKKLTCSLE